MSDGTGIQLPLIKTGTLSKGFKSVSYHFRRQGGRCSLCGGQMVLVNLLSIHKNHVRAFRLLRQSDRVTFDLMATIDHHVPRSVARGVPFNRRAAHRACNEVKGSALIECFPLPCFEADEIRSTAPRTP